MRRSPVVFALVAMVVGCAPQGELSRRETTFQQKMHRGWAVGEYEGGKKVGPWTYYYADGKPRATGAYFHGAMHGRWRFCDGDGRCWSVEYWDGRRLTASALVRLQAEGGASAGDAVSVSPRESGTRVRSVPASPPPRR